MSTSRANSINARTAAHFGSRSTLNNALSWFVLTVLAIAPIPLASNRPFFWAFWALAIGLAGALYLLLLLRSGEGTRIDLSDIGLPVILMGLTYAYLVIQLLPIAGLLGLGEIVANGIAVPSTRISVAPGATLFMLLRQLTYGLLFFLVLLICVNDQRRHMITNALLLIVMGYAVYALYNLSGSDRILGMPKWGYYNVATATFVNRNSFATFLGLGAIIALGQIGRQVVRHSQRHPNDGPIQGSLPAIAMYGAAYLFLMATIFATGSRMGLASTLLASLVVAGLTAWTTRRIKALILSIPVLCVVIAVSIFTAGFSLVDRLENVEADTGLRQALYEQVIELISLRPLFGFGGGAFEQAFPLVHRAPVSYDMIWQKAHSTYLSLWAELGLVFGSLPVIAVAILAWRMLGALRDGRGAWSSQTIALAAIALCGAHSTLDFSLEIEAVTLLFVTLVAAGLASSGSRPRQTHTGRAS